MNKNNTNSKYIQIGGRTVAVLRGHVLDVQRYDSNLILFEPGQPPSLSLAQSTLHEGRKANLLRFLNRSTGETYTMSRADFDKHSRAVQVPGYELQRAVPITRFAFAPGEGLNIPKPIEREPIKPREIQMTLNGWMK